MLPQPSNINYCIGPISSRNDVYVSRTDLVLRQLTFNWSRVSPDCLAIHYNILASNCGSCPTTTNHTTVTCTGVPTDGSMCTFTVQPAFCANIVGDFSNAIKVLLLLKEIRGEYKCTGTVISSILFGGTTVCTIIFLAVSVTITIRRRRISARTSTKKETPDCHYEAVSHDHQHSSTGSTTIDTRKNVAYGHAQKLTITASN